MRKGLKEFSFIMQGRCFLNCLFLIIAIIFSYYFMHIRFVLNYQYARASLLAIFNGSAAVPFQYRILIPWFVRMLENTKLSFGDTPLRLFRLIEFLSIFSLAVTFRYYLSLFFKNQTISTFVSLTLFYVLPFNFLLLPTIWYPWDMPAILLFTLGLILLYKKKWTIYYLLFIVATLNKETTCFLTLIYLFTAIGKDKPKTIALHCFFQLIIWCTIKYFLYQLYFNNPGAGIFEGQLSKNINFFKNIKNYPFFFSNMGFLWIPTFFYFRLIEARFVKRSLLVIFPFFLVMMLAGNIIELRAYGELIPVVLVAFLLIIKELLKRKTLPLV